MKYAVIIEKTRTGYSAYAPDVPGCGVAAKTIPQVKRRLAEAMELHLQSLRENGEAIPRPTTRAEYLEAVA